MTFRIQELKSAINAAGGLLQPAHFLCVITVKPQWGAGISGGQISFLCDSAVLPGLNFQTQQVQMYGYGQSEQRPIQATWGDFRVSFFCDARGDIVDLFHTWSQNIYNISNSGRNSFNGARQFEFQYPTWFETVIEIYHFDTANNQVLYYQLNGAYPKDINEMQVNWADVDNILRLEIGFAYNYWTSRAIRQGEAINNTGVLYRVPGVDLVAQPNFSIA